MDPEKLKEMGIQICIPGMRLSAANKEYASGPGTYELKGYIYATLAGLLKMLVDEKTQVSKCLLKLFFRDLNCSVQCLPKNRCTSFHLLLATITTHKKHTIFMMYTTEFVCFR